VIWERSYLFFFRVAGFPLSRLYMTWLFWYSFNNNATWHRSIEEDFKQKRTQRRSYWNTIFSDLLNIRIFLATGLQTAYFIWPRERWAPTMTFKALTIFLETLYRIVHIIVYKHGIVQYILSEQVFHCCKNWILHSQLYKG
jgi:hypothetical protein